MYKNTSDVLVSASGSTSNDLEIKNFYKLKTDFD
jgi:hypothetical protein